MLKSASLVWGYRLTFLTYRHDTVECLRSLSFLIFLFFIVKTSFLIVDTITEVPHPHPTPWPSPHSRSLSSTSPFGGVDSITILAEVSTAFNTVTPSNLLKNLHGDLSESSFQQCQKQNQDVRGLEEKKRNIEEMNSTNIDCSFKNERGPVVTRGDRSRKGIFRMGRPMHA